MKIWGTLLQSANELSKQSSKSFQVSLSVVLEDMQERGAELSSDSLQEVKQILSALVAKIKQKSIDSSMSENGS